MLAHRSHAMLTHRSHAMLAHRSHSWLTHWSHSRLTHRSHSRLTHWRHAMLVHGRHTMLVHRCHTRHSLRRGHHARHTTRSLQARDASGVDDLIDLDNLLALLVCERANSAQIYFEGDHVRVECLLEPCHRVFKRHDFALELNQALRERVRRIAVVINVICIDWSGLLRLVNCLLQLFVLLPN